MIAFDSFAPIASLVQVSLDQTNDLLIAWEHKMGPIKRGKGAAYGRRILAVYGAAGG